MGQKEKLMEVVLKGTSDSNINFDDLRTLLKSLGFEERIRGSHHIFRKAGVVEKVNLQCSGKDAKPYQVKQVREIIIKYNLMR